MLYGFSIKRGKIMQKTNFKTEKLSHSFNPSILRAYDIRGEVGKNLNVEDAYFIGRAYGTKLIRKINNQAPRVAVGMDGRVSSPALEGSLISGLISTGCQVVKIGVGPSPMLYFAVRSQKFDGGVMVTASHNPPQDNGFKMMIGKESVFGDGIYELGDIAKSGDFENGVGNIDSIEIKNNYLETLLLAIEATSKATGKNLKVAWDAGNGSAGYITELLCKNLQGEHHAIFTEIDGTFPNHHADPTKPENLKDLAALVKKNNCDFGIGFDGDGDRIGVVDENGRMIYGDQLLIIYAREIIKNKQGAKIIADVKASNVFIDKINEFGGQPIIWKTGHSYIKNKLSEEKADLAGEMSGHIFFADKYYGYDDALYAAVRLINIMMKSDKSLAEMIDELPKTFSTPELRKEVDEKIKFKIVEDIKARLISEKADISDIDGVRVNRKNGWWLIRASNTQSAVTMRAEGDSEESLKQIRAEMESYL
jgi:phosphomannomutase